MTQSKEPTKSSGPTENEANQRHLSRDEEEIPSRRAFIRLVPDAFKGELAPRQMRASALSDLKGLEIAMSQRFVVDRTSFFDAMQAIAKVTQESGQRQRFYFRGESNGRYTLVPSLMRDGLYQRLSKKHGATSPLQLQRKLLDRYRRYTQHLIHKDNDFSAPIWEDFDTLCLAQHHGLPTLLMDWTLNAYIAAYFALSEAYKTNVREALAENPEITKYVTRVWVMKLKKPEDRADYTIHLEDRRVSESKRPSIDDATVVQPRLIVPLVFTRRIAAQVGRFVYCGYMSSEFNHKGDNEPLKVTSLAKYSADQCKTGGTPPSTLCWEQLYSLDIEFDIGTDEFRNRFVKDMKAESTGQVSTSQAKRTVKLKLFREEIMKMMSDLEFAGYHAGTLFPDLEGWARYLAEGNL